MHQSFLGLPIKRHFPMNRCTLYKQAHTHTAQYMHATCPGQETPVSRRQELTSVISASLFHFPLLQI